jgi:hypothetical protein
MILAIIFIILAYRRAKAAGKSGPLWGLIAGGVFIGTQLLVGLGAGIILTIYVVATTGSEVVSEGWWMLVNIVAIVISLIVTGYTLTYIDRIPNEAYEPTAPPPPPVFHQPSIIAEEPESDQERTTLPPPNA